MPPFFFHRKKKKGTLNYAGIHSCPYKMAPSCSPSVLNFLVATLGCFIFQYEFCDSGLQNFDLKHILRVV